MAFEIDFLPVGNGDRSGDAIAFRLGNINGQRNEQFVGIVDGGFAETGEQLVSHVKKWFNTETIDLVVSTHPDDDHSSGLVYVLENLQVGSLWMHQPWNHTQVHRMPLRLSVGGRRWSWRRPPQGHWR